MLSIIQRHIQEASNSSVLEPHWGYVNRILPCTNDAGSCEYLDSVYWMHDVSMLYTFILWAVIGSTLMIVLALRISKPRSWRAVEAASRKWFLPKAFVGFFGNFTRLQFLVLAILLGYLLIFSLVGIVYRTWITPVKNSTLHNTRTGLGGFADRVGALAYALTPLTIALSSRESILTLVTGIPYQSFNFLHRWLGRVILVQSFLHTLGWTPIESRFYQPQPTTFRNFISEPYIVWGCIAMLFITFLYVFSLRRVIAFTGHEFFRKSHYVVAGLYLGACWAHWSHLACWMIASLGICGLDRGIRLFRTAKIHFGYVDGTKGIGFHCIQSTTQYFHDEDGGVVRLDLKDNRKSWAVGQHYFLTFPTLTIWQSHPFTVASVPGQHYYIIRCRKGETGRLKILANQTPATPEEVLAGNQTPVILCGPYGAALLTPSSEPTNLLAIAGGTGVSLTLPLILAATASPDFAEVAIDFIWIVRRQSNLGWIANELDELKRRAALGTINFRVHVYITQEVDDDSKVQNPEKGLLGVSSKPASESSIGEPGIDGKDFETTYTSFEHPSIYNIVCGFKERRASSAYRTRVIGRGPASMGHDLRATVAACNGGVKVLRDEKLWDMSLDWDDRMG